MTEAQREEFRGKRFNHPVTGAIMLAHEAIPNSAPAADGLWVRCSHVTGRQAGYFESLKRTDVVKQIAKGDPLGQLGLEVGA